MNKTRTIIIDGIEIQTSLTGVEIAGLVQRNKELEQQCKKQKEVIDKAIEYINDNLIISSILDGKKYYTTNNYSFDYRELLDILNEVE